MSEDLAGLCCASLGAALEICVVGACYDFASFSESMPHSIRSSPLLTVLIILHSSLMYCGPVHL